MRFVLCRKRILAKVMNIYRILIQVNLRGCGNGWVQLPLIKTKTFKKLRSVQKKDYRLCFE